MTATDVHKGRNIHGFIVTDTIDLPELNLRQIQLVHERTGARYLHLAADDDNCLFAACFRTPPEDSTGVAHILEHTVLCGSERYPVRDPFFAMIKRSLNTFMNAMTASDWTSYPFASQNPRDFDNLLGIYLDAVFFPLLREEDFLQEGHRLEFDEEGRLTIQGVVFNEMKGAMASPSSLLSRRLAKALYPTTTYRHNSGGEPEHIPELTWQQLRDFHARYYHPSNSWLFSYGNRPLEQILEQVDRLALSRFERLDVDSAVPPEKRLEQPRQVEERFPLDPAEPLAGRSMVQIGWLTCDIEQGEERMLLHLLSLLLLGNPAAPLYRALLESGLGSNLAPGCGYHDDNRTTCFAAGLQGTDPDKAEAIEQLVLTTLDRVAREGFDSERVEAALHRLEFANREVTGDSYPYPLLLLMRLLGSWLHADDPVTPLKLEQPLARLRKKLQDPDFLGREIRRLLLDNRHRVRLLLRPDHRLQQENEEKLRARLDAIAARLTPRQADDIRNKAEMLRARQELQDDLSCLPCLTREDIRIHETEIPNRVIGQKGRTFHFFPQPTNGIAYLLGRIDCGALDVEEQSDLAIQASLLPLIGSGGRDYLENAALAERYTGGLQAGTDILERPENSARFRGDLVIRGKALVRNSAPMANLLADMALDPDFGDLGRIRTVLGQIRTSLENSIPGSGHSYAARHAAARLTPAMARREAWNGISLLRRVRTLLSSDDNALREWAERSGQTLKRLLGASPLQTALVAEDKALEQLQSVVSDFMARFPAAAEKPLSEQPFSPRPGRIGLATSVPVAYVARSHATVPFDHDDAPLLLLLAKLLKSGYLHREIREKGGAYGGLCSCNIEAGTFSLLSYRDPHIVRTLEVYDRAIEWAANGKFDQQQIEEAVLSVFADLDRPLSPGGRGSHEFANLLQGLGPEKRQQLRQKVLAATRADLARAAQVWLADNREQGAVAVIAGRDMLEAANRELPGASRLEIEPI